MEILSSTPAKKILNTFMVLGLIGVDSQEYEPKIRPLIYLPQYLLSQKVFVIFSFNWPCGL